MPTFQHSTNTPPSRKRRRSCTWITSTFRMTSYGESFDETTTTMHDFQRHSWIPPLSSRPKQMSRRFVAYHRSLEEISPDQKPEVMLWYVNRSSRHFGGNSIKTIAVASDFSSSDFYPKTYDLNVASPCPIISYNCTDTSGCFAWCVCGKTMKVCTMPLPLASTNSCRGIIQSSFPFSIKRLAVAIESCIFPGIPVL